MLATEVKWILEGYFKITVDIDELWTIDWGMRLHEYENVLRIKRRQSDKQIKVWLGHVEDE